MKKILLIITIVAFTSTFALSWSVTSDGPADLDDNDVNNALSFQASKKVNIDVNSTEVIFAATSKHFNGDKEYGLSSDSSVVFVNGATKGSSTQTSAPSDGASGFSAWDKQ